MSDKTKLLRVTAPHFTAGAVWMETDFRGWICISAAPRIKWMVGKSPDYVKGYLEQKKWKHEWL